MADRADDAAAQAARDWIVRLNSGDVSEADLLAFKAWRAASDAHRLAFDRERIFWSQLQVLAEPAQPRLARRGFLIGGGAMAAAAAGAFVLPSLALSMRADAATRPGQVLSLSLPDGSSAMLNTDSALAYDFGPGQRGVTLLKGEAGFTITPQATPFRIRAGAGECTAASGRFSLRRDGDLVTVTAFEGRGLVDGGAGAVALDAGQQIRIGGDLRAVAPIPADVEQALAWQSGRIIIEARPLDQALRELGRYIDERLVIARHVDGAVPVSGVFSIPDALAAMTALARTQGLGLRRVPGVLILIS